MSCEVHWCLHCYIGQFIGLQIQSFSAVMIEQLVSSCSQRRQKFYCWFWVDIYILNYTVSFLICPKTLPCRFWHALSFIHEKHASPVPLMMVRVNPSSMCICEVIPVSCCMSYKDPDRWIFLLFFEGYLLVSCLRKGSSWS